MTQFDSTTDAAGNPRDAEPAGSTPISDATKAAKAVFGQRLHRAPQNEIITYATETYLALLDPQNPPTPRRLEQQLLAMVHGILREENGKAGTAANEKLPMPRVLNTWQIAQILLHLHHVIRIAPNAKDVDREYDLLAMYQATGPSRGTYSHSEDDIRTLARHYNTQLTLRDFGEVLAVLREDAPRKHLCTHPDLFAVNNGVAHYGTGDLDLIVDGQVFHFPPKGLVPFHPALVFMAKPHIDYVSLPTNPVITNPDDQSQWDIVSWMRDIADDDEQIADLLWEIIGAVVRPHVSWNKTAWFYSEQGNNGKGTLCALMRNLCGPRSHTSIPLSDFGRDFALEPLVRANAIIVDENDVGTFIDKAANLKAIVTNDVIQINRKYRMPLAIQFWGINVQCLNEFPRVKDKSESFYRRQLFVPFTKSYTGRERRYIKDDYLQRREVLEYALWYVINQAGASTPGCYYQFSEPPATKEVLAEYKETNDPVRGYWQEFRTRLVWDLIPFTFAYDLYKAWFAEVSPSGSPVSHRQFVTDLVAIVRSDEEWHCPDKNRQLRPHHMMDDPEPLIAEYELRRWMDPLYSGNDPNARSRPMLQSSYRGLLRRALAAPDPDDSGTSDDAVDAVRTD